jgi:hypothetical protein
MKLGLCEYRQVIVPACDTLNSNTVRLLKEFMSVGGKVYTFKHHLPTRVDGRPADLSFLSECEDISLPNVYCKFNYDQPLRLVSCDGVSIDLDSIRAEVRITEFGRLIYITNLTDCDFGRFSVSLDGCERLGKLDISTLEISPLNGRRTERGADVYVNIMGSDSVLLCEYGAPDFLPYEYPKLPNVIKLDSPFVAEAPEENMLTLDRVQVSLDGGEFSELRPIERVRDELLSSRYKGRVTLRFPFNVKSLPGKLRVITEPFGSDSFKVNGIDVRLSDERIIDRDFRVTDIAPMCRAGENLIDITLDYYQRDYVYYVLYGGVSESLRNCLAFDTEIECIYLTGDFALDMKAEDFTPAENNAFIYDPEKGMSIVAPKIKLNPENIVTEGYPFYCGKLTASAQYTYKKGDATVLRLTGRFATARVSVNGKEVGKLLFSSYIDLGEYLTEGVNTVTVTVCNSYRNLFGPHHREPAEPLAVSPRTFSYEKMWKNGRCELYNSRYAFVRFGIDR